MNRKFIGHLPARTLRISPWAIAAAFLLTGGMRGFVLGFQDLLWAAAVGGINWTIRFKNLDASLMPQNYVFWPFPIIKLLAGLCFTTASIGLSYWLYRRSAQSALIN